MLRTVIVLALLLIAHCAPARAVVPETPRFRIIGAAEGLPSTEFFGIERDRDGYIWIATGDGLARYDGTSMRVWRHQPDNPASLPGNSVNYLHIDARDRIWVATENAGVSVLDRDRRGFRHYRKADHPEMGSDDVFTIASRGDDVWFGAYDGGLTRMAADGRMTHFAHDEADGDSLPSDTVMYLAFDSAGTLWIGTLGGLARFDGTAVHRVVLPGEQPLPRIYSVTLIEGTVWVGAASGVFLLGPDGTWRPPDWAPMFERPNAVLKMFRDPATGGLWLGSQRGLWRVRPGEVPVPVPLGGPGIVRAISSMLLQADGALWVPVAGAGLGYLRSDWNRIAQFSRTQGGLEGDLYRSLAPAQAGGVWLGGYDGTIERLDGTGTIERLDEAERERMKNFRPFSIAQDDAGRLWLGNSMGLTRIGSDGAIDAWTPEDRTDPTLPGQLDQLAFAADGSLWVAAQGGGVQQRDPASGRVLRSIVASDATGLGVGEIEQMAFAPDGALWATCPTGMLQLAADKTRFVPVRGLEGERVFAFAFDGRDVLWLQRLTGLEQFRRDGDGWQRLSSVGPESGLPSVSAGALRVDARHRVWMASARGMFRWSPGRRLLRRFGVQQGLSSQEFLERALALTADGMLAAGTADGAVVLFDTVASDPPPATPTLRIDGFAIRRDGRWHDEPLLQDRRLPADDVEFRVGARLFAYDDPTSNRYWSKLEGFDRGWVQQGASGERSFSGLSSGDYVLRVRATDPAGNAAVEQRLRFSVLPPWWRTAWARTAMVLLALVLTLSLARSYRQRVRRRSAWQLSLHKRELAEQASLAKTRFLATLGHEVRTPMTGVLGMSELLLSTNLDPKQRGYIESIRRAGDHLMRLVNDALDLARIEAGRLELDPQAFDLQALVEDVDGLMAPIARHRGLAFHRGMAPDLPRWHTGDAGRVRQILLNLLGNAIKFTDQGEVALQVEPIDGGVRFVVSDTGPGLNDEQRQRLFRRFEQAEGARTAARYGGSGLGLAICQELAAAMGGRIDVESVPGFGTRFTVELPLTAADAPADAPLARTPTASSPGRALRLLLVEDDPTVAEVITGLLRAQGHRVVHVAHGLAALSETATAAFDLVLLDLDLPGLDGLALARQLRAQGFEPPLLAVTARADAEAEPLARAAGFDGFLRKPLSGDMLAEAIDALLPATAVDAIAVDRSPTEPSP